MKDDKKSKILKKKIVVFRGLKVVIKSVVVSLVITILLSILKDPLSLTDNIYACLIVIPTILYVIYAIASKKNREEITIEKFIKENYYYSNEKLSNVLNEKGLSKEEISIIIKDRKENDNNEVDINQNLKEGFNNSNSFLTKMGYGIIIDEKNKCFAVMNPNQNPIYVDFKDVFSYDKKVMETNAGGELLTSIGNLTGNAYAYRSGMQRQLSDIKDVCNYSIKVNFKDLSKKAVEIRLLHKRITQYTKEYNEIVGVSDEITHFLDIIIDKNKNNSSTNNLEELKKLKELLDMEAITKEEYEKKKKELLKD